MSKEIILPNEFDPRYYQQRYFDFYDHGGRAGMWVWHRRAGKDLTALHQICKQAMERVGMYWHCLPSFEQARKAVWNNFVTTANKRLMRQVFPRPIVRAPDDFKPQAAMMVELVNGSIIQLIGSDNIDNIVGASPVHVTFSEFALCKPNSYDLIRPMLRESNGTVSFITTPRGKNHAHAIYEKLKKQMAKNPRRFMADVQTLDHTEAWRGWKRDDEDDEGGEHFRSAEEVYEAELLAGMQQELIDQEYKCDWTAALVGSVYGDLLKKMDFEGRLQPFDHDGGMIFTNWDLGMDDATSIWFWEIRGDGASLIDFYEARGKPLSHYRDVLEEKASKYNFTYYKHWIPHDARAKTLAAAGVTIEEQLRDYLGQDKVEIVAKLPPLDGIQAFRWLLQRKNTRIHPRCNEKLGIEALKMYHYEYDERAKAYTNKPEHDWTSHAADAARYLGVVIRITEMLTRAPAAEEKKIIVPVPINLLPVTLNDLFEAHEAELRMRSGRLP